MTDAPAPVEPPVLSRAALDAKIDTFMADNYIFDGNRWMFEQFIDAILESLSQEDGE